MEGIPLRSHSTSWRTAISPLVYRVWWACVEGIPLRSHSTSWRTAISPLVYRVWWARVEGILLSSHSTNWWWPSLPRFTESDEPVWRGYLYAVILPDGVEPFLPRFTVSDEPVWRGNLYAVILLSGDGHLSLGLQSLMSQCGEDTSMWLPSPSPFSPTSSSVANTSWCSGKLVLLFIMSQCSSFRFIHNLAPISVF